MDKHLRCRNVCHCPWPLKVPLSVLGCSCPLYALLSFWGMFNLEKDPPTIRLRLVIRNPHFVDDRV